MGFAILIAVLLAAWYVAPIEVKWVMSDDTYGVFNKNSMELGFTIGNRQYDEYEKKGE